MERAEWLAWLIRRLQPDVVHSMEFQRAGYLTLEAKKRFRGNYFPPWIATNWGSDVSLFGKLAAHAKPVSEVLQACDYHHSECRRDLTLAREYGFRGEDLPVIPGGGGFDISWMNTLRSAGPTSSRRHIALKGYQNWAGRALFGLRALEQCSDVLREYVVSVYLAENDMVIAGELFSRRTGIQVQILPPGRPYEEIVRLHGQARVSLGLSISDAASTSALEAMIMGSFPVQSDTGCFCEWATDGETTLLVPPEDCDKIASALRSALTDDDLVDKASTANAERAAQGLDKDVIKPLVIDMYSKVAQKKTVC
jgi:glycosyltransferase involved in cell wall biosynthesis